MARQTAMKTTKAIPEIGDLVRVRQRHWVVTAVRPSDALSSASQDTDFSEDPQNLVELISIDEDARAETLSVVWEIEPDASVENPKLPDLRRFDDYATFENFLNAVRWGAVSNINDKLIQSPYRSGITIEDYQLDPVVRAVNMANVSLMIADDVDSGGRACRSRDAPSIPCSYGSHRVPGKPSAQVARGNACKVRPRLSHR